MSDSTPRGVLWTRREVITRVSAMLGGATLIGQAAMLAGCAENESAAPGESETTGLFGQSDVEKLGEIAETILPATATPGARAAGVGPFIAVMVTDSYSPDEQKIFLDGLATIDDISRSEHGKAFVELDAGQRHAIAKRLDLEQHGARQAGGPPHFFRMLKELTVLGYFTSELAYNEVLEYAETPGRYEPCRILDDSVRMMAGHAASMRSN